MVKLLQMKVLLGRGLSNPALIPFSLSRGHKGGSPDIVLTLTLDC